MTNGEGSGGGPVPPLVGTARTYQILARLFGPPDETLRQKTDVPELRAATAGMGISSLEKAFEEMEGHLARITDIDELAREYVRLFRGPAKVLVYQYASMYLDGEIMGPATMQAIDLYTEAGLQVAGDFKDLPDHITTELEFVTYLCFAELESQSNGDSDLATRFADLRDRFTQDHLGRWVPRFAREIEEHTTAPFYRGLAAVTGRVVGGNA